MSRNLLFALIILLQLNCGLRSASDNSRQAVHPLHDQIAKILQGGWDITQSGNVIHVTRREPVSLYTSVALPLSRDLRREIIDQSKESIKYEITIEIGERLSEEKFLELQAANDQTEWELRKHEYRMTDFVSKANYSPQTPKQVALYREYQEALRSLPYHRLPDLHDPQNSYYIVTSRPGWTAFYYPREEHEMRAVLENIYAFADAYRGKIEPFLSGEDPRVSYTFSVDRDYDNYLHKKSRNLPAVQ